MSNELLPQSNGRYKAWWKGSQGEWWVVTQALLLIALVISLFVVHVFAKWPLWLVITGRVIGTILFMIGVGMLFIGLTCLGRNLTPLPKPKKNATLKQGGIYRFVRHPMYGGVILLVHGLAFLFANTLTLIIAVLSFAFYDGKASVEEEWLTERFPEYKDYRKRTRKLVPWIY
jgi:protein-S-isoprenylcysteine O-methyltransferase Ste14